MLGPFDLATVILLVVGVSLIVYRSHKTREANHELAPDDPLRRPSPLEVVYFNSPTLRLLKSRRLKMPWATICISLALIVIFFLEAHVSGSVLVDSSLILTGETLNLKSLSLAQFLHAGWSHLINNLVALILFGVIVENWLGTRVFLATYTLGGYVGIYTYVKFFSPPDVVVLGASANISAVIGAYAIFRLWVWRPIYAQILGPGARVPSLGPQLLFYIYFVFGDDLSGIKHQESGIAFGAHLVGSIVGIIAALTFFKFSSQERIKSALGSELTHDAPLESGSMPRFLR